MTSKEALERLQYLPYRNEITDRDQLAVEIINKLVERDTPKKVIFRNYIVKENFIVTKIPIYYCPNCKEKINVDNFSSDNLEVIQGCIYCLQRLDWG